MKNNIDNCLDIINYLASVQDQVAKFTFNRFSSYNLLQERIDVEGELKSVFGRALEVRQKTNLPFWDSFNVSIFDTALRTLNLWMK